MTTPVYPLDLTGSAASNLVENELHTLTEHTFTLYFQPVLPATGIFDTSVYAADGELSLSAAINSSVTSMSVTTSNALVLLETTAFPYTLVIDSEWLSVTACTSAASTAHRSRDY